MKTNIKMRVTPEQSMKVQNIVIANLNTQNKVATTDIHFPYIVISTMGTFGTRDMEFYKIQNYKEIDADLFIRTNGTCEENTNYKSGDFLKCIVFYDTSVSVGATYQIQTLDKNKSRITFIDDELDTRSIEISRLNKYFKKVENKYTELSTSIDKPYNVPILEKKLKKKNEILKKARIKRKNQREELHKLNIKLQKCISSEEHRKVLNWHIERNESLFAEIHNLKAENIEMGKLANLNRSALDLAMKEIEELNKQIEKINKDNINYLSNNILSRDKEIEKLKAVIEYLESKVK